MLYLRSKIVNVRHVVPSESPSKMGWHTDHDHKTKKVRGILCHACNSGLGLVKEDVTRLLALAQYLVFHKTIGNS